jgi:hypothetical protein
MKNFDDDVRDLEGVTHEFTLRGETFVAKPIVPGAELSKVGGFETNPGEMWQITADVIRATLKPEYRERWDQVLTAEYDIPIGLDKLIEIMNWLVERSTGRPPTLPSPSGNTGASTTTKSTDGSGSTAEQGLPIST